MSTTFSADQESVAKVEMSVVRNPQTKDDAILLRIQDTKIDNGFVLEKILDDYYPEELKLEMDAWQDLIYKIGSNDESHKEKQWEIATLADFRHMFAAIA